MLIQNNKVIYHKIKSFNGKKLPIWNTCVFWLPEFLKSDIFVFGAVQVYLDGTPLKSSKDTLVHENVFYLLRSNVTDAVVYLFLGQLKKFATM